MEDYDDKFYKEYRAIATRFLKETGLLCSFKRYIKACCSKNPTSIDDYAYWYKKGQCIDRIFGSLNFTTYLMKEHIYLPTSISTIFRTYVRLKYGRKHRMKFEDCCYEYCKIDENTGQFIINGIRKI